MLKRSSFQSKIIIYHILIIFAITIIMISLFYQYVVTAVKERSDQDFETIISKTVTQYENLLYNMDKTALQIAANPSIVNYFQKVDKDPAINYFIKEPVIAGEVVKLLNSYNFKSDAAIRICLYNNYGDFACTATTVTTKTGIEKFFNSDIFKQVQSHFGNENTFNLYLPPCDDILNDTGLSQQKYFSVIREIKDYSSVSLPCGYVEIQEKVDKMDDIFKDLGEDGYAVIFDQSKQIIYKSPSYYSYGDKIGNMDELTELVQDGQIKIGFFYKKNHYISYKELENSSYTILFEKPRSTAVASLLNFNILLIISAITILITVIFTEVLIVKRLSRPLIELNKSIHNINIDTLRLDIEESKSNNELQQLQEAFNSVFRQLKVAIDKQYISRTNELKSHLFALQSQMNPHFLYNILAIISMETQDNEKIQNICSRLCKLLSFSSSMNGGFCRLGEEMDHACNYLALMKERYEVLFEYTIQIEQNIHDIKIPKLIVQPICENCFKHAFKNREPVWRITTSAYQKEDKWYIEIHDNGPGFSEEYLLEYKQLQQEITLDNVKENLDEISIGGLSIVNIYMRMLICYEADFTCKFYNDNEGAVVLLGGKIHD